ncbi:MAG: hypothetical protein AAB550_02010 [Patescibacteria group bacterium]
MQIGEYDPRNHAGIVWVGQDVIVADAGQAKLNEAPDDIKIPMAQMTLDKLKEEIALADFSRGIGGAIIQIVNESAVDDKIGAYARGIVLLGLTIDQARAASIEPEVFGQITRIARLNIEKHEVKKS